MSPNEEELRALIAQANALTASVDRLNSDIGEQVVELGRVDKQNHNMIRVLAAVVIVQLVLGALVAISLFGVKSNTDRLDRSEIVSRQEALCPLYELFLESKSPQGRDAYPQGPEAYDQAFMTIQHGYDALQCSDFQNP